MTSLTEKISRNSLFTFCAHIFRIAVGFVLLPYIVATIGKERFGLWVIVAAATQYCGLFDLGLSSPFSKYIAEYFSKSDEERLNQVVNTGLLFYVLFGVAAVTLFSLAGDRLLGLFRFSPSLHDDALFVLRIGILIFVLEQAVACVTSILRGLQRIDLQRKVQMGYTVVNAIGTVLVLRMGYGIRGLLLNDLICFMFSASVEIWLCFRIFPRLRIGMRYCTGEMFLRLLRFGARIQTSRFSTLIALQFDKFLIGHSLLVAQVAYYDIGAKIPLALRQFALLIFPILVPAFSEMSVSRSRTQLYGYTLGVTKLCACVLMPAMAFSVVGSQRIIEVWMGGGYGLSARIMQILSVGYLVNTLLLTLTAAMQGVGRPHYQMWSSLIYAMLNIALSLAMLRVLGICGPPLGTSLAMLLAPAYFLFATHRFYFRQPILPALRAILVTPLVSSILAAAPIVTCNVFLLPAPSCASRLSNAALLALQGAIFASCYLLLLKRIGYFSRGEKDAILRAFPAARLFLE
ncbi:MAG: oligosaccharide flippase family protein [bacterium]|nr:oligosaccharide flippase family protein [bacterium]